ncbi:MAG: GldG family protein [Candidatus Rokubacteria bacterium]|nr:GldG family protein [Candidatus Rokubacteria bacterium]MBI3825342.1 GldG family protein [Candidatus Rokubacteria bacterium]
MKRVLDWLAYAGIAVLVAAIALPFARPEWGSYRGWVMLAGVVLVALSLLVHVGDLRTAFARRSARYGVNAAVMILIVLGITVLLQVVVQRHSARLDLTENRRNSLAPQTIQLLRTLPANVNAVGFFRSDVPTAKRSAEDLLKQYARYSNGKFTWRMADPDREPTLARTYGVETYGTVVLETKAKTEKVLDADEEKLTNGLVKVTREGKRTVYVLQGHGEHDPASSERAGFSEAKAAMERSNYEVKPLVLLREAKVPDDAAEVIVPGPRTDLLAPELDALEAYLGRGGKLLLMLDSPLAQRVQEDALRARLAAYGFEVGNDLVIETSPVGQLFGIREPYVPVVLQYESHPITRDLGGVATIFPIVRSVGAVKTPPAGVNVQVLAKSSPQSWAETDREEITRGRVEQDAKDLKGPVGLAAVATRDKARIVLYGTSNIASNQFLNVQGNRDFFLNSVSWLAEEESQISIRPRETKQTPIFMSGQQAQGVFVLSVIGLPAVALVGLVVSVIRRRAQ